MHRFRTELDLPDAVALANLIESLRALLGVDADVEASRWVVDELAAEWSNVRNEPFRQWTSLV